MSPFCPLRLYIPALTAAGFILANIALAQSSSANISQQTNNATTIVKQLHTAFSGDKSIQTVQLNGSANWYAGSLTDFGSVTLTASASGTSEMQLSLASSGSKTETQEEGKNCQWSGNDGVAHPMEPTTCSRSILWYLPSLSLQGLYQSGAIACNDLGTGAVGSGETIYRHLRCRAASLQDVSTMLTDDDETLITTDIGFDQATLLPSVLFYYVRPDNGAPVWIAIEVRYSDYRETSGVQFPFHIQRYMNGSLQLDIQINSTQVN